MTTLTAEHEEGLQWFESRTGQTISWPTPLESGLFLVNRAKGIHKPAGWAHALSIKVMESGVYPDEDLEDLGQGRWRFRYHQEERVNTSPETYYTNRGLAQCMLDNVPIGVLRQVKSKPNPQYQVIGLGYVTRWEDGFFTIEGPASGTTPSRSPSSASVSEPISAADARERVLTTIAKRRGQREFRARLLRAYGGRCCISGCDVQSVLEAAHIVPYRGDQTNIVSNGLLLRADLHTLFDLNLISIDPASMSIRLAPELQDSEYGPLHGQALATPGSADEQPLAEHFLTRTTLLMEHG